MLLHETVSRIWVPLVSALSLLVLPFALVGCDALGGGDAVPNIDGRYDFDAQVTVTAGRFRYDGEVVLAQDGSSFSGSGDIDITLEGDPAGTRKVDNVRGTYNHPNITMIWEMEDPNESNPNEAYSVWSIDANVTPAADSIDGLIEVAELGGGAVTLVEK